MRLLVVHNDYGTYSGEEAAVDKFIADRRAWGDTVETLRRTSKFSRELLTSKIKATVSGLYSAEGVRMMKEALMVFKPDVVNVHNLFPFISPASLFQCKRAKVPVVMTVHNYRLICPNGLMLRDESACDECARRKSEWACIKHNCQHSRFQSLAYAARNMVARKSGAYRRCVDMFCCLTHFQKQMLQQNGIEESRLRVIPNYANEALCAPVPEHGYVGYVGRASHEKGYDLLVEVARKHPEITFKFAGAESLDNKPQNIELLGSLNSQELEQFYRNALFIAMPSRCYEGLPNVMLEAFSHGRAVIVPNHGAFPTWIKEPEPCATGFEPNSADSLEAAIMNLYHDKQQQIKLSANARACYLRDFTAQNVHEQWSALFAEMIERR